jgi:hypothetical protein
VRAGDPRNATRGTPGVAGGRPIPRLLFVTSAPALGTAINNPAAARQVLDALGAAGHAVLDTLPAGATASQLAPPVRTRIRSERPAGVVILGGYDVVAPQVLDVLDPPLRRTLPLTADPDNFIVWSDDVYGDAEGDSFPEVPVSRIPDGGSAQFLRKAIDAPAPAAGSGGPQRRGVRNLNRPFADAIWADIPGTGVLLQSAPAYPRGIAVGALGGHALYFMLHGSSSDATRFLGEDRDQNQLDAVDIDNIPDPCPAVVFTGCCWGAMLSSRTAYRAMGGMPGPPPPRRVDDSIPMRCLSHGANAYLGCTGAHYSPDAEAGFFGGPMHRAFWRYFAAGRTPAQALLLAKTDFRRGMPHGQTEPADKAIEKKILWQYTCLGLGW